MTSMPTLKVGGTSFANDPKALALLLYRVIGLSRNAGGIVSIGELIGAARDIGYRGPVSSLSRMLLAQGFLAEWEGGKSFFLREEHYAAARQFFLEHEALLSGSRLSDAERHLVFDRLSEGSEAERTMIRIMKLLSALSSEFRNLAVLERAIRVGIAEQETAYVFALEREVWLAGRRNAAYGEVAEAHSCTTFDEWMRSARAEVEADGFEAELTRTLDAKDECAGSLHRLARQEELVLLLHAFRYFFDGMVSVFVSKEGG